MRLIARQAVLLAYVLILCIAAQAAEQRMVRLAVFDDTRARRIPPNAKIWFRGHGPVLLRNSCDKLSNGSLTCDTIDLGMRDVAQAFDLLIYPNGRRLDGTGREIDEIKAVFKMTSAMCSPGCVRDQINVWISDSQVEVWGSPIKAQHGKVALTFKRR